MWWKKKKQWKRLTKFYANYSANINTNYASRAALIIAISYGEAFPKNLNNLTWPN